MLESLNVLFPEYVPNITTDHLETSSVLEIQELTDLAKRIFNEREKFEASLKDREKDKAFR